MAIAWAAQTALRDILGKIMLADILVGRETIDHDLQHIIDERTTPWGVSVNSVNSVESRGIITPQNWKTPCRAPPNVARATLGQVRRPSARARRA